jgi:hypothetical protein
METTTYLEHYIQTNIEPTSKTVCDGDLVIYNDLSYSHLYVGYNHIASGYGFASSDIRNDIIEYATYSYNYVTNLNLDNTTSESSTIITYENTVTIDEGKNTVSFGVGSYTLSKTEDNVIYIDSKIKSTILDCITYSDKGHVIVNKFSNPSFIGTVSNINYIDFDYIGSDTIDSFWITYNTTNNLYGSRQTPLSFKTPEDFNITYTTLADSELDESITYCQYSCEVLDSTKINDLFTTSGDLSLELHIKTNNREITYNIFNTYLLKPIYYTNTSDTEYEYDDTNSLNSFNDLTNYPFIKNVKFGSVTEATYGVILSPEEYDLMFYLNDSFIGTSWIKQNISVTISNEKYVIYRTPQKYNGYSYWDIKLDI